MWIVALMLFIIGMTLLYFGARRDSNPMIASAFVLFIAAIVLLIVF